MFHDQEVVRATEQALDAFMDSVASRIKCAPSLYAVPYDPDWPSVCYQAGEAAGQLPWLPEKQKDDLHFRDLEKALGLRIHPTVACFFCRWYSFNIKVQLVEGQGEILQVISPQDFAYLQENIIGHVLMQRQLRLPPTIFIGVIDDSEAIISLDNTSGQVGIEFPGKAPHLKLSDTLAKFLSTLPACLP